MSMLSIELAPNRLTGGPGEPSILNGNTWDESEVSE